MKLNIDNLILDDIELVNDQKQYVVDWFKKHEIPLYGVNKDPDHYRWTQSPKVYAELYIDDSALGCPLKYDKSISDSRFVDYK